MRGKEKSEVRSWRIPESWPSVCFVYLLSKHLHRPSQGTDTSSTYFTNTGSSSPPNCPVKQVLLSPGWSWGSRHRGVRWLSHTAVGGSCSIYTWVSGRALVPLSTGSCPPQYGLAAGGGLGIYYAIMWTCPEGRMSENTKQTTPLSL